MSQARSREAIMEEVEELAEELMDFEPSLTVEAARSYVLEGYPELYSEFSKAQPDLPSAPVAKSEPELSLADVILGAVQNRAGQMAWNRWPATSLADLEYEVWKSDEGQVLYETYRSDLGRVPYSQARQQINKRADGGPWAILDRWLSL